MSKNVELQLSRIYNAKLKLSRYIVYPDSDAGDYGSWESIAEGFLSEIPDAYYLDDPIINTSTNSNQLPSKGIFSYVTGFSTPRGIDTVTDMSGAYAYMARLDPRNVGSLVLKSAQNVDYLFYNGPNLKKNTGREPGPFHVPSAVTAKYAYSSIYEITLPTLGDGSSSPNINFNKVVNFTGGFEYSEFKAAPTSLNLPSAVEVTSLFSRVRAPHFVEFNAPLVTKLTGVYSDYFINSEEQINLPDIDLAAKYPKVTHMDTLFQRATYYSPKGVGKYMNLTGTFGSQLITISNMFFDCQLVSTVDFTFNSEVYTGGYFINRVNNLTRARLVFNQGTKDKGVVFVMNGCPALTDLEIIGLDKTFNIYNCASLTTDSIRTLINGMRPWTIGPKECRLQRRNYDELTEEDKKVLVDKGYILLRT